MNTGRLLELRRAKGMSQHALSLKVGMQGAAAISAWERGVSTPRPSTLLRVARVLGVDPIELLAVGGTEGRTLRELRLVRGMTLRELADAASTSSSALRRWESGRYIRVPGADVVCALARALDVAPARVEAALMRARNLTDKRP
ncbi:helix-turn-helix transcriptional regulator [uncultured Serinicoccus sp.]|uniref:helix-turn-helix domain-containing protein n=1 Tax=uncultured Serinicoccus sp. TaxID=735514 RepID=UPI003459B782